MLCIKISPTSVYATNQESLFALRFTCKFTTIWFGFLGPFMVVLSQDDFCHSLPHPPPSNVFNFNKRFQKSIIFLASFSSCSTQDFNHAVIAWRHAKQKWRLVTSWRHSGVDSVQMEQFIFKLFPLFRTQDTSARNIACAWILFWALAVGVLPLALLSRFYFPAKKKKFHLKDSFMLLVMILAKTSALETFFWNLTIILWLQCCADWKDNLAILDSVLRQPMATQVPAWVVLGSAVMTPRTLKLRNVCISGLFRPKPHGFEIQIKAS